MYLPCLTYEPSKAQIARTCNCFGHKEFRSILRGITQMGIHQGTWLKAIRSFKVKSMCMRSTEWSRKERLWLQLYSPGPGLQPNWNCKGFYIIYTLKFTND